MQLGRQLARRINGEAYLDTYLSLQDKKECFLLLLSGRQRMITVYSNGMYSGKLVWTGHVELGVHMHGTDACCQGGVGSHEVGLWMIRTSSCMQWS